MAGHDHQDASVQDGPIELTVVVPAHNSSSIIEASLARLSQHLAGRNAEIVVVENGSTDDTYMRCQAFASTAAPHDVPVMLLCSEKGKGYALRTGIRASSGASVLLIDDDLPFGFDALDAADRILAAGSPLPPVLIGSKAHPASVVSRGAVRGILTWGFTQLCRWILGMRTGDPQGTILMDGRLIRSLTRRTSETGFLFTTELVYLAERRGLRPLEIPVRLSDVHSAHPSRVSASDVPRMGWGLFRVRRNGRRFGG
jgi:glycosyltransferase involved in cell wall biosynthesis